MRGKHLVVAFAAAAFVVASATSARSTPTGRVAMARIHPTAKAAVRVVAVTPTPPTVAAPLRSIGSVALTFDDGPSATFTPQVLDVLRRYDVKATFFVVGSQAAAHPGLVRRIVREGHHIGNHTWDHYALPNLDDNGFRVEVDQTQALLRTFTPKATCIRPPFGRVDARSRAAMRARGLQVMRWSVDSDDWKRPGADVIVANLLAGAEPNAVLLLHDGGPDMSQTVAALPALIEGIHARGLSIAPIC